MDPKLRKVKPVPLGTGTCFWSFDNIFWKKGRQSGSWPDWTAVFNERVALKSSVIAGVVKLLVTRAVVLSLSRLLTTCYNSFPVKLGPLGTT